MSWLHQDGRYGESISIIEPLVKKHPDTISYRVYLIKAYAKTNRPNQTEEQIAATDKHFRMDGRWNQSNMYAFAECLYDIGETRNVAEKNPDVVTRLNKLAKDYDANLKANSRPIWRGGQRIPSGACGLHPQPADEVDVPPAQ